MRIELRAEQLPLEIFLCSATYICREIYIRSLESVFEIIAEPSDERSLTCCFGRGSRLAIWSVGFEFPICGIEEVIEACNVIGVDGGRSSREHSGTSIVL